MCLAHLPHAHAHRYLASSGIKIVSCFECDRRVIKTADIAGTFTLTLCMCVAKCCQHSLRVIPAENRCHGHSLQPLRCPLRSGEPKGVVGLEAGGPGTGTQLQTQWHVLQACRSTTASTVCVPTPQRAGWLSRSYLCSAKISSAPICGASSHVRPVLLMYSSVGRAQAFVPGVKEGKPKGTRGTVPPSDAPRQQL